jgi:hypothetical protein
MFWVLSPLSARNIGSILANREMEKGIAKCLNVAVSKFIKGMGNLQWCLHLYGHKSGRGE